MAETEPLADAPAAAAMKFPAIEVDWQAFSGERWRQRSQQDGFMCRALQHVVSKDDVALEQMVRDSLAKDPDLEALRKLADHFDEHATFLRDSADVFDLGYARLFVAITRVGCRLDRDGNPLPAEREAADA